MKYVLCQYLHGRSYNTKLSKGFLLWLEAGGDKSCSRRSRIKQAQTASTIDTWYLILGLYHYGNRCANSDGRRKVADPTNGSEKMCRLFAVSYKSKSKFRTLTLTISWPRCLTLPHQHRQCRSRVSPPLVFYRFPKQGMVSLDTLKKRAFNMCALNNCIPRTRHLRFSNRLKKNCGLTGEAPTFLQKAQQHS